MRRKVLLVGVLILAMLLQLFLPFTTAKAASSVEITLNSKLYEAIKSQLEEQGIEASYYDANGKIIITESELAKVTELNLQSKGVEDLTNLSAFSNLTYINLTSNKLISKDSAGNPCTLAELNNLPNLNRINLSTNKLENVDAIRGLIDDPNVAVDITNQTTIGKGILKAKYPTNIATVKLPKVLSEDKSLLPSRGIILEVLNTDGSVSALQDGRAQGTSFTDAEKTNVDIEIAYLENDNYTSYNDLVKITVDYNDKVGETPLYVHSPLNGAAMTFYYVIVGENETGIIFNDENLYYTIKEQLTAGQNTNNELGSYGAAGETLYNRAYDEALILVIDDNVIINQIPSLILNDRQIKDLTGIEEFVGLETDLNVSYNYIDSIQKIIELEENKTIKERELQTKFSSIIDNLKEVRENIQLLESNLEMLNDLRVQLAQAQADGNADLINSLTAQIEELLPNEARWNIALYGADNTGNTAGLYYVERVLLKQLYDTFEKEYRITSLLSYSESILSYQELRDIRLNASALANHYNAIVNRICDMEAKEILFDEEIDMITSTFGIARASETPISDYFAGQQEIINYGGYTEQQLATYYYETINNFKFIHIASLAYNYCLLERMYNQDVDECVCAEGLLEISNFFYNRNIDLYYLNAASGYSCDDDTTTFGMEEEFKLAGRLAYGQGDIPNYIILTRLQSLNIENNQIESIDTIGQLTGLRILNARQNLVDDISQVAWSQLTMLKQLDLGYNQISNIKPLEVLTSIAYLYLDSNLISGSFDFYTTNMIYLEEANFDNNQIANLSGLFAQYQPLAWPNGYETGEEYFKERLMNIYSFQGQYLTIDTTAIKTGDFITLDLPPIFAQFERIDSLNTSFGIDSWFGLVYADGTKVKLRTPSTGNYTAIVTVEGDNGFNEPPHTEGMGYGSKCIINYTIIEDTVIDEPTDPDDTPYIIPDLEYGYTIENDYIVIYTPGISLDEFKNTLVPEGYTVEVAQNPSQNIATGSVVTIYQGEEVIALIEVVVKGDVNGDGIVNGTDSGIIRNIRDDVAPQPEGVYFKAADVNNNNKINTSDYVAVLQYRADFISSFEDL